MFYKCDNTTGCLELLRKAKTHGGFGIERIRSEEGELMDFGDVEE
jgi:hypothetical protein